MHGINEIRQLSKMLDWNYIPSEQNPEDLCTRTQTDFELIHQKWLYGLETIHKNTLYLKEINNTNQFQESLETNTSLITHSSKIENCNSYQILKWNSYSS